MTTPNDAGLFDLEGPPARGRDSKPAAADRKAKGTVTPAEVPTRIADAIELVGTIIAIDPIAISTPLKRGGKGNPVPAQSIQCYFDAQLQETLFVPGTSLRGRLRHSLTQAIMRAQVEATQPCFTVRDYIQSALGGVLDAKGAGADNSAAPDDDAEGGGDAGDIVKDGAVDVENHLRLRISNPVLSLFGSMSLAMSSRLHVRNAIPKVPVAPNTNVIGGGARANPLHKNAEMFAAGTGLFDSESVSSFLREAEQRASGNRLEDEAERLRWQARQAAEKGDKVAAKDLAAAEKARREEAKKIFTQHGKVNFQQVIWGWQSIPAGTEMSHSIRLEIPNRREAALLFAALQLLAARPIIGGHVSTGCGRIAIRYEMLKDGAWAGRISLDGEGGFVAESNDPDLAEALADIQDAKRRAGLFEAINLRAPA